MRKMALFMVLVLLSSSIVLVLDNTNIDAVGLDEGSGNGIWFAGGDGTPTNPYQISNVTQLQNISANVTAHYVLINDINASSTEDWIINTYGGKGFRPIEKFYGSLDGKGYNITGLFMNEPRLDNIGLFSRIYEGGKVSNLNLLDVDIYGEIENIAGLVGYNQGSLINCSVTGYISGLDTVAGLVGENDGIIESCSVNCTSVSENFAGTIFGNNGDGKIRNSTGAGSVTCEFDIAGGLGSYNYRGIIENCSFRGEVSGDDSIGGLVGNNYQGTILNSSAFTNSKGSGSVGGLVGHNAGTIKGCSSNGSITGNSDIGGLVGSNIGTTTDSISNCNVNGSGTVGGFAGSNHFSIERCHGSGLVRSTDIAGGFAGLNYNMISNCSSDADVSNGSTSGGFIGYNYLVSHVIDSFCSGRVQGDSFTGSFAGINRGTIVRCFSTGPSTGRLIAGGFAGTSDTMIKHCYSSGSVNSTEGLGAGFLGILEGGYTVNCYSTGKVTGYGSVGGFLGQKNSGMAYGCLWDIDTSGTSSGSNALGKNTTEMMNSSTFIEEGWDLENIWIISDGRTYPYLRSFYHSPMIIIQENIEIDEDSRLDLSYDVKVSDYPVQKEIVVHRTSTLPSWLEVNTQTFTISGTPGNDNVGDYTVIFELSDLFTSIQLPVTISVININDDPEIKTTNIVSCLEDSFYLNVYEAVDIDPTEDMLTWIFSSDAEWLDWDTEHDILSGQPRNRDVGSYWVNLTVEDGNGGLDFTNFTLEVVNTNDAPIITTEPVSVAFEDMEYSLVLEAGDIDVGDQLAWELLNGPGFLSIEGNILDGTPSNDDVGSHWIRVLVSDLDGKRADLSFMLEVLNTNDAPAWTQVPTDQNITEGRSLLLKCRAEDMDGDIIQYNISSTTEIDITIDPSTGTIWWGSAETGDHLINITASDGNVTIHHLFHIITKELPDDPDDNNTVPDSNTDTDDDGIPDWWEEFFGLDPEDPSDASGDPDNDNITNLDEYLGKTSPAKDDSIIVITDDDDDDDIVSDDDEGTDKEERGDWDVNYLVILLAVLLIVTIILLVLRRGSSGSPARERDIEE